MHEFKLARDHVDAVARRCGRPHPFDALEPRKTALVVIDMQNHFMAPGFMNETPQARAIVPGVNRLAAGLRAFGGQVVWIQNSTNDTWESWSNYHTCLMTSERAADIKTTKKRYSAFIQGSSDIEARLRALGVDTVMVAGTATQVCCESTARDACMLNFKTLMISDANATWADDLHSAALTAVYLNFGDVQTIDEALASLARGGALAQAAE